MKDNVLNEIARDANMFCYAKNELIIKEGDVGDTLYIIFEGEVLVTKEKILLAKLGKNDYFGEMVLVNIGEKRSASVRANSKCMLIEIKASYIKKYIIKENNPLYDLLVTFDKRLRSHNDTIVDQYKEIMNKYIELEDNNRQLLRTDKLAEIGILTSSIAHEINNPLSIIRGYAEIIKSTFEKMNDPDNKFLLKAISRIEIAEEAITKIVNGIQNYVRKSEEDIEISLNDLIQTSIDLVSFLYKKEDILLITEFASESPKIKANFGRLQQVILNLLSNSKYALKYSLDKKIIIRTKKETGWAIMEVEDFGCGISPKNIKKIFDRFFTTKKMNHGTGLGLGIIKDIIEKMEGTIEVKSIVDEKTTFTLKFPPYDK